MSTENPFETLHISLAHALHKGLPDLKYKRKDWVKSKEIGQDVFVEETKRPDMYDVTIDMFPQTWSDTSLGFGGMAGQAFTSAYTVVVCCPDSQCWAVYNGGRFAYLIDYKKQSAEGFKIFQEDLMNRNMAGQMKLGRYK